VTFIDSHCHLDDEKFDSDRNEVIARARDACVRTMLAIGTGDGPPDLEAAIRLADRHDCIYATVGVHPHNAAQATPDTLPQLVRLLDHPKVVALGEMGLDYHYDFSPRDRQHEVFIEQMAIALAARRPIVIHTREAWADTMTFLREHWDPTLGGIMHCFSGGPDEAREALDLGFYLSFGGVVTFPKAVNVQDAARMTPADRLLIETDAPYLAPVPRRGKRNEPAFVVETARHLAGLRATTVDEIAEVTSRNFERVFSLSAR